MSWSFNTQGPSVDDVRAQASELFDREAKRYEGTAEAADVLACKERCLVAIDEFPAKHLEADSSSPHCYDLKVSAYGSRGGGWLTMHVEVARANRLAPVDK